MIKSSTDIVVVADPCPSSTSNFYGTGNIEECIDAASKLLKLMAEQYPLINAHLVRVRKSDVGYNILSCKLRTGAMAIYKMLPQKSYYFKIDTDTIVFPRRFHQFLTTLTAVTEPSTPVYFGTEVESGMGLLLCGREWTNQGDTTKGGLCYAQGGAGYGLNNVAMQVTVLLLIFEFLEITFEITGIHFSNLRSWHHLQNATRKFLTTPLKILMSPFECSVKFPQT